MGEAERDWHGERRWGSTIHHLLSLSELVEKKVENGKKVLEIIN